VQNLFFAYLFVLRAVMKAAPVLTTYQYDTGLAQEDQQTQALITQLVSGLVCRERSSVCCAVYTGTLCTVSDAASLFPFVCASARHTATTGLWRRNHIQQEY
jgi:hypothetical protein